MTDSPDPWRLRCPEGHANITRRSTADRADPQGARYYCGTCSAGYDHAVDRKTGERTTDAEPNRPREDPTDADPADLLNYDSDQHLVDQDMIVACIRDLLAMGFRDGLGGGIASAVLADILPWSQSTLADNCRYLCDDGRLVEVRGVAYNQGNKARPSFLPADHPDAPADETPDGPPRTLAEVSKADD
jgi:hypothetical protein